MRQDWDVYHDVNYLRNLIHRAARDVRTWDFELLRADANEPCLSHRFALYLEGYLRERDRTSSYQVDCEYNRLGLDSKSLSERFFLVDGPHYVEVGGRKLVVPDVIVHKRGPDGPNLIAIEVKTTTNIDNPMYKSGVIVGTQEEFAKDKITGYVRELGYYYSALLCFSTGNQYRRRRKCHEIRFEMVRRDNGPSRH